MRAFLGEVGRRQVDDDALARQAEADRGQRAAHPLLALRHLLVRQADDGEGRHPARHLHLHVDAQHVDALECDGADARGHECEMFPG